MKTYIKIVILLLTNIVLAQEPPVLSNTSLANPNDDSIIGKDGNYAKDTSNERNQYIGIWEYNQNGILFQVKIEKKDKFLNQGIYNGQSLFYNYCDVVTFKYRLVKNGLTIYNNLNQVGFPTTAYIPTAIKKASSTFLYGGFFDATKNVIGTVIIKKLNTTPAKIDFNLILGEYQILNPNHVPNPNEPLFTMPTGGIEMVKIN